MDPTKRFSTKAQNYACYRPDYAPEILPALMGATGLTADAAVIDVGAGTGRLTRHLLDGFETVTAVEPNPKMCALAEAGLGHLPGFRSLDAPAEAIPLPDHSVDLIAAGRELHWFQAEASRAEFQRLVMPGGWMMIVRVNIIGEELGAAIQAMRTVENGFEPWVVGTRPFDASLEGYCANYQTLTFLHIHEQGFAAFVGGLQSGSYSSDEDHPRYANLVRAARQVFDQFSQGGIMRVEMQTSMSFGQVLATLEERA